MKIHLLEKIDRSDRIECLGRIELAINRLRDKNVLHTTESEYLYQLAQFVFLFLCIEIENHAFFKLIFYMLFYLIKSALLSQRVNGTSSRFSQRVHTLWNWMPAPVLVCFYKLLITFIIYNKIRLNSNYNLRETAFWIKNCCCILDEWCFLSIQNLRFSE